MSRIVAFKFSFLMILLKLLNAAKYDEEPFQKFTVLFQQQHEDSFHDGVTMNLHGEAFHCSVPADDFLQSLMKNSTTVSNIGVLSKKINSMPCILAQDALWMYLLCPDSDILQFSRLLPFVKQSLGTKFTDILSRETLRGFRDSGDRVVLTRRFTDGGWCDFERKIITDVRFYCRQDAKDVVTKVEKESACEYAMHVHTRHACSGVGFESEHGYPLHCRRSDAKHVLDVVLPPNDKIDTKSLLSSSNQYPLISAEKVLSLIDAFDRKVDEPRAKNDLDDIFREAMDSHVDLRIVTDGLAKKKLPKILKQYASFQYDKLVFDEWKTTKDEKEDEKIKRRISQLKLGPSVIPYSASRKSKKKKKIRT